MQSDVCVVDVPSTACLELTPASDKRGLRIVVKDLRYTVHSNTKKGTKVCILNGVSAWFERGEMAAVMGASGSGKSSLLDLLSGRKTTGHSSGLVLFGSTIPSRSFLRRHTGYVEQFDTLVDSLSVREMLLYTAELKRPMGEPLAAKKAAVEVLLGKLALTSCKDVRIGSSLGRGISGGQAKRVNIGIALITNPQVLFLDEPTSGLDSTTANEVMEVVKDLGRRDGTTICAAIHAPSSHTYHLFDSCLLLAGGSTAFFGGPLQPAITFFTAACSARQPQVGDNLAEWMMDIVIKAERAGSCHLICEAYDKSALARSNHAQIAALVEAATGAAGGAGGAGPLPQAADTAAAALVGDAGSSWAGRLCGLQTYATSPLWSLRVLLQYRTLRNYRDPQYLASRLVDKVIFAVVIMLLYLGIGDSFTQQNVPSMCALMYLCIAQPAWGAVTFLPAIVLERGLYVREHNDGLYRPLVYLVFKMVDELAINWAAGLLSCAIMFFGIQLQGSFLYFWLMLQATLANGVVIAYCLAALCPTMDVANAAVPTLLAIMLFLSGFLIRVPDIPAYLRWFSTINLLRYSWAGLMLNQFGDHPEVSYGGAPILDYYGLSQFQRWDALAIVAAFFCTWMLFAWLVLAFVRHHRR